MMQYNTTLCGLLPLMNVHHLLYAHPQYHLYGNKTLLTRAVNRLEGGQHYLHCQVHSVL